ncbi:MAG: HD domain-containing protein [Candidatus Diapherotrites archaeon]|nr:HD domain-containing protein [Candidatus Diapherotrites archaeon]
MGFLEFESKVLSLKDVGRTGWKIRKVKKPESVADHCFSVALLCKLFAEDEKLNVEKCVSLALVHDLHESVCGDICSREFEHEQEMTNAEKERTELAALEKLLPIAPENKKALLSRIAKEYFAQKTPEAKFVRDMDLVEVCLQALYYKKNGRTKKDLSDFFRSASRKIKSKTAKALFEKILEEFNQV